MKCQHCGAELDNKRAKNCPRCSAILTDANKRGVYGFVMEAVKQAKEDGLTGEAVHEAMKSAAKFGTGKRDEWNREYQQMRETRNNERKAREEEARKFYMEHGRWPNRGEVEDARDDIENERKYREMTPDKMFAEW